MCHTQDTFSIWVTAQFVQGSTTYYTNAASKLSTTGPAEEVEIKSSSGTCGSISVLNQPITLAPDANVSIVLYADPTLAVYGALGTTPSGTESCITDGTVKLCADFVSVFGTIDTAAPTVERYQLAIPSHADVIMSLLFDSSGAPFGASGRPFQTEALSNPAFGDASYRIQAAADGTYDIGGTAASPMITGFQRAAHAGTAHTDFGDTFSYVATPL